MMSHSALMVIWLPGNLRIPDFSPSTSDTHFNHAPESVVSNALPTRAAPGWTNRLGRRSMLAWNSHTQARGWLDLVAFPDSRIAF
jgi:hypothetical protein